MSEKTLDGLQSVVGLLFVLSLWEVLKKNDALLDIWHGHLRFDSCVVSELGCDISDERNDHLEDLDILCSFNLCSLLNEVKHVLKEWVELFKASSVICCHYYNDVLVNYHLSQLGQEFAGVFVEAGCIHGHRCTCSLLEHRKSAVQELVVESCSAVHAEISKSVQGWQFYLSVEGFILQNVLQTRHEVIEVLIHLLTHATGEVRDDAAGKLGAVVLLGLKCILDILSNLLEFNLVSETNNHALEGNEAVFGDFLCLFEHLNNNLDNIGSQWLFNHEADFDENNLKKTT